MAKNSKSKQNKTATVASGPSKYSLENIKGFSAEIKSEFSKIAWPDKKHTLGATGVVVVLVMVISFYLGTVDLVVGKIIGSVLQ